MLIIKGVIKTSEIRFCQYIENTHKFEIEFNNGKRYSYGYASVEWLKEPQVLNPNMYRISRGGREFFNIDAIYVFKGMLDTYVHVCFGDGSERDYLYNELNIVQSCLSKKEAQDVFLYLRQIANLSDVRNEETGEKLLPKNYEKISFIGDNVALAKYLLPKNASSNNSEKSFIPIFPFGCNNSQYMAVKRAMENQISVIQGPPGTGKTQTILNIIANILMQGKTVQIVSNNNSATENVYDKLSSTKYNLGFIVAMLGNVQNKKTFIAEQDENYPDFSKWKSDKEQSELLQRVQEKSALLKTVFDKKEELATLKQELHQLETEQVYFFQYIGEKKKNEQEIKTGVSSKQWMKAWQECQLIAEHGKKIGLGFRIKTFFRCRVIKQDLYKQELSDIISYFQTMYYCSKHVELKKRIAIIDRYLQGVNDQLTDELCGQSMILLKDKLAKRYEGKRQRQIFTEEDLRKKSEEVLKEYPIILSTTFSSRNSLNSDIVYDYLIMDEASQVDVATGALALSCAKNVVIVGDTKQLPNVVKGEVKAKAEAIFDSFSIHPGYQFTKSFLQSVLDVIPNVPQTLLREHYRCHPKIINFCNQKFYKGELIIMTKDEGEDNVLSVIKTVQGNHVRDHFSQRQIDVIKEEIIPCHKGDKQELGIIAPYKNQVEGLAKAFSDIDAATVHKFQGKEKDTIIISTVDDVISDFADDPYLINVAVSRAKKKLILVVTGNEQKQEGNISDLIQYIQYNNFEVSDSKIYSIFDYLYSQYTQERIAYFRTHRRIAEFDSENLMYGLLQEILAIEKYAFINVACHVQMNMLIKSFEGLDEREQRFILNPATHIDFLLYNRISKRPMLAIEVDGYQYHKDGTKQDERDMMKNHILNSFGIPLLRFKTNGSREREQIVAKLEEITKPQSD